MLPIPSIFIPLDKNNPDNQIPHINFITIIPFMNSFANILHCETLFDNNV
jgi:hypothetical protein